MKSFYIVKTTADEDTRVKIADILRAAEAGCATIDSVNSCYGVITITYDKLGHKQQEWASAYTAINGSLPLTTTRQRWSSAYQLGVHAIKEMSKWPVSSEAEVTDAVTRSTVTDDGIECPDNGIFRYTGHAVAVLNGPSERYMITAHYVDRDGDVTFCLNQNELALASVLYSLKNSEFTNDAHYDAAVDVALKDSRKWFEHYSLATGFEHAKTKILRQAGQDGELREQASEADYRKEMLDWLDKRSEQNAKYNEILIDF